MLLEIAIGDAYGAAFEFANLDYIKPRNDSKTFHKHPWHKLKPGCYTDDTQMSIAVAEVLLMEESEWTSENFAMKFVKCFKRDPRKGYAKGFYAFLNSIKNGKEFLEKIRPDSEKSGAAMRSVPLGLIPDINKVIEIAELQAKITHDTPVGIRSSQLVAVVSHIAYYNHDLMAYPHVQADAIIEKITGRRGKFLDTTNTGKLVDQACRASEYPFSDMLFNSCKDGGDTDTICAIASGIRSLNIKHTIDQIPVSLIDNLENSTYGKDYLIDLDKKLFKKFPKD